MANALPLDVLRPAVGDRYLLEELDAELGHTLGFRLGDALAQPKEGTALQRAVG